MLNFLISHQLATGVVAYFLLQSIVTALPEPVPGASLGYRFIFNLFHNLTSNLARIPALRKMVNASDEKLAVAA